MTDLPVHPLCDLFPLMEGEQYARFVEDIKANGLIHPVVVHNGQLVDGRNRLRACQELGINPVPTVEWLDDGYASLERWIWSTNVERRNLTPDQLAAAIVGRNNYERTRGARGRFVHHLNPGDGEGLDRNHLTRSRLAKEAGVSQNRIERARMIQLVDPDLLKEVVRGTVTLFDAAGKIRAVEPAREARPPAELQPAVTPVEPGTVEEREAKDRMVRVLSHVRGLCRGFDTMNIPALRSSCDAKEQKVWAEVARSAARILRGFAADLLEESKKSEAHN